jgi:uncharacterized protein involved in outer membrane biogenesis
MKKLLIILGIVVVVLVAGVAILVANLDNIVNDRKDYILEKAETAVGRDVAIDDIGVTLRGGLGVKLSDVTLADDPRYSSEPFVTAKDLTVRVKLWPLIKKQVEVKRLVLNEPVINVIRDEQGVFNFASIAQSGGAEPSGTVETGQASTAAAAPLALAFADIKNGTVRFSDRQAGLELEVNRIDFTAKNAALGQEASVDLKAAVLDAEQNIRLEGTIGPVEGVDDPEDLRPTPLNLTATLEGFTVDQLRQLMPGHPALDQLDAMEVGSVRAMIAVTGTLGALELSGAELAAAVLGATDPNVNVRLNVEPFDALASAEGGFPEPTFNGRLDVSPLPMDKVLGMAGSDAESSVPAELQMSGDASVAVEFGGTPQSINLDATVDVTNGSVRFGEQFNKPAGVPMGLTANVAVTPLGADIKQSELTAGDLTLGAKGTIALTGEAPEIDVVVRSAPTDVAALTGMLPMLEPFSPQGIFGLVAAIRGALAPGGLPSVEGTFELKQGGAQIAQMPRPIKDATARVKFTENTVRVEDARAKVGRSSISLKADAASLRPLKATYRVRSGEVYRDDFNTPPKPAPRPEILRNLVVSGSLRQEGEAVRLDGEATSANGTLANVDYSDLQATIGSSPDRIDIDSFSAKTLGGTVEGRGAYLPKETPPRFEVTTRVRSVNLTEYFSYKVKSLPQFIEGTIDVDLELAGAGKEWEQVKPTLTGGGGAVVVRGSLLNVNVANEILSAIAQLPLVDQNAVARVRQNNPKLFSGDKTAFKDLKGNVRIENGRIHSKGLVLKSDEFSVFGEGWFSLDRQMDLNTNIVLSAAATQGIIREVAAIKYITNDKGQLEIPLSWTGALTNPALSPNLDALSKKLQDSAIDSGIDKIRDELGGEVGDAVKDIFKGLGKKKDAKKDTTRTP